MFSVDVTFSGDTRLLSNIGTAPVESTGVSNVEFFMHQIQCINYGCLHCPVKSVFLHCCDLSRMSCAESQALCNSSSWRPS